VGVSDYGAILSTPPSSAARTRTPTPSKAKKKVLLTPVMVLQSEEEGGRAGGEEEDMWSSPFEGLFSPRRGSSLSPSKGKNRVLLTPITPERQREGGGWKEEEEQEWEQAEEVKEEWVSRERGEFKDDMRFVGREGERERGKGSEREASTKKRKRSRVQGTELMAHNTNSSLPPFFPPSLLPSILSYATHVSSAELDIMTEEGGGGTDWWKPLALGVCFLGVIVADVLKVQKQGKGKGGRNIYMFFSLLFFLTFLLSGGRAHSLFENNIARLFTFDILLLLDCHNHPFLSSLLPSLPPSLSP